MFQSVVLSVSSDVITFHHGGKGGERGIGNEPGKTESMSGWDIQNGTHTTEEKGEKVLCRVESELPLVPISLCLFMGQTASLWCRNRNGRNPLGWHVLLKGRPPDVYFDPVSYAS